MKLYVCWGTMPTPRLGGHPCRNAYTALREAGHDPEVIKVHGVGIGPVKLDTDGRREVERIAGTKVVPVLVTDTGEVITESKRIAEWARENPAGAASAAPETSATAS